MFVIGDRVLVNKKYQIEDAFVGKIGTIVCIKDGGSRFGVDFGEKISRERDDYLLTHALHGTLKSNTGYYFDKGDKNRWDLECLSLENEVEFKF